MSSEIDVDKDAACFTFIWAVQNYSELVSFFRVESPWFSGELLGNTKWRLLLVEEVNLNIPVACKIERIDTEEGYVHANFDLAILGADGMPLVSKSGENNFDNWSHSEWLRLIEKIAVLEQKEKFLPNDTLTLRCQFWVKNSPISRSDICFARTVLGMEKREFFWTNKEFSQMQPGKKRSLIVQPLQKGAPTIELALYLEQTSSEDDVVIEVNLVEPCKAHCMGVKISVIDANGQLAHDETKGKIVFGETGIKFEPFIQKSVLLMDKSRYLLNDTLFLKGELNTFFGVVLSRIESYGHGLTTTVESRLPDVSTSDLTIRKEASSSHISRNSDISSNSKNVNDCSESCFSFCPLKRAVKRLENKGIFPDVCLNNGKKVFYVHKNILRSKSPIFKKMISKNATTKNIDLDTLCLHDLLTYIYTGTVADLNKETALDMLEAAKEFKLSVLEERCFEILKSFSTPSNVFCELPLSGSHQDRKSKRRPRDIIFDTITSSFF